MAKCSICNSRKGKRKCKANDSMICSLCCGQSRTPDKCTDCSYYQAPSRNYRNVPFYSTQQMANSDKLEDISNVIESTFCEFYTKDKNQFTDKDALQLLELAFDKYYFKDPNLSIQNPQVKIEFETMVNIIEKKLSNTTEETLIKVMSAIYRSIQRRTNGGKEYLTFIQQYVGRPVKYIPKFLSSL